jgi:hypothetical protein
MQKSNGVFAASAGIVRDSPYDGWSVNVMDENSSVSVGGISRQASSSYATNPIVGTESGDTSVQAAVSDDSLDYVDHSGTFANGWPNLGSPDVDNPPFTYGSWSGSGAQLAWHADTAGLSQQCSAAGYALSGRSSLATPWPSGRLVSGEGASPPRTSPAMSRAAAAAIAREFGSNLSSAKVQVTQLAHTSRGAANALLHPGAEKFDPDHDVYAAVVDGAFSAADVPLPPASPTPTGSTLVLVIDADTGTVLDWGLRNSAPDLTPLGATSYATR